jgi:hypothetical protein
MNGRILVELLFSALPDIYPLQRVFDFTSPLKKRRLHGLGTAIALEVSDLTNKWRTVPMADVNVLIDRIDQVLKTEVERQKTDWANEVKTNCDREPRLQRFEVVAKHVMFVGEDTRREFEKEQAAKH